MVRIDEGRMRSLGDQFEDRQNAETSIEPMLPGIPLTVTMDEEGYESLARILLQAYNQSARGKGKDRHANQRPFDEQPILRLAEMTGVGGPVFQAMKKQQEAVSMTTRGEYDKAIHELLGSIVYSAAAIRHIETLSAS